jgi:hypothetical protein
MWDIWRVWQLLVVGCEALGKESTLLTSARTRNVLVRVISAGVTPQSASILIIMQYLMLRSRVIEGRCSVLATAGADLRTHCNTHNQTNLNQTKDSNKANS